MENLEHYLDQVCRGIAGPREMRLHIRQELREHLLDAVTEHRAAGLSEDAALAKALGDFGGPQEVRSELEAQHGHRMVMALVIDKALEWKEKTMKAKWLWTTWTHLALVGVIVAEVAFMWWVFVVFMQLHDVFKAWGWLDDVAPDMAASQQTFAWSQSVLATILGLAYWFEGHLWLWIPLLIAAWAVFEWRSQSENKSLIRLSALGTIALALMAPVAFTAAAIIVEYAFALPSHAAQAPDQTVKTHWQNIDPALAALDQAIAKADWDIWKPMNSMGKAIDHLYAMGAAAPTLIALPAQARIDQLRAELNRMHDAFHEMQQAGIAKDQVNLEAALKQFRAAYSEAQETIEDASQ